MDRIIVSVQHEPSCRRVIGTIPQFDASFYAGVGMGESEALIAEGVIAKLRWAYGKVFAICIEQSGVEKVRNCGFEKL